MTDPLENELVSLREASQLLPGKPHISTIHRWRLRGIRGVKLVTVMVGGRRYVHRDSLREFIIATTAARVQMSAPPASLKRGRSRAREKAEKQLADEGL